MKRNLVLFAACIFAIAGKAQNLELRDGKDIKQPALVNPALAGLQEDMFRLLTNANLNNYSFLVEGKIPLKMGNYTLGVNRISNEYVSNSMFNITYGRTNKKDKKLKLRYGGSLQFSNRSSLKTDADSTGIRFVDLNGETSYLPKLTDLNSSISYVNFEFGGALQYNDLIASLSLQNILNPDVSLIDGEGRRLPLSANLMVGGFLHLGEKYTLFPSAIAVYNNEGYYAKTSLDFNTPYFNLAAAYIADELQQDLNATLAMHYKRMYFGLIYSQPIEGLDNGPELRVFLNSALFKDKKLFKSDFAKQIAKFY